MRNSFTVALPIVALLLAPAAFTQSSHPWLKQYQDASTCTACHRSAAEEIMSTSHWTWEHLDPVSGDMLGKKHVINNYCIAVASNEPRCTSCPR